jgi:hypothetical protein
MATLHHLKGGVSNRAWFHDETLGQWEISESLKSVPASLKANRGFQNGACASICFASPTFEATRAIELIDNNQK